MPKYHVHVVKVVSEHQFDIVADNINDARAKALKKPLTPKSRVKPGCRKVAITFD